LEQAGDGAGRLNKKMSDLQEVQVRLSHRKDISLERR